MTSRTFCGIFDVLRKLVDYTEFSSPNGIQFARSLNSAHRDGKLYVLSPCFVSLGKDGFIKLTTDNWTDKH